MGTLDDCFHMIAGDCSSTYSFGVLARSMSKSSESKELKIFLNKTEVLITPSKSYSRYIRDIKLFINGTEVVLMKNTMKDPPKSLLLSTNLLILLFTSKPLTMVFPSSLMVKEFLLNPLNF